MGIPSYKKFGDGQFKRRCKKIIKLYKKMI